MKALIGMASDGIAISIYGNLDDLPHFNPVVDGDEALTPVKDWPTPSLVQSKDRHRMWSNFAEPWVESLAYFNRDVTHNSIQHY